MSKLPNSEEVEHTEQLEALNPGLHSNNSSYENISQPNLLKPPRPKDQFILERVDDDGDGNDNGNSDLNKCGIGCFKPSWIQRFATKKAFMLVFSILAVIQGMSWAYFTATITTLEKRFKISSQTAGSLTTFYIILIPNVCVFLQIPSEGIIKN